MGDAGHLAEHSRDMPPWFLVVLLLVAGAAGWHLRAWWGRR